MKIPAGTPRIKSPLSLEVYADPNDTKGWRFRIWRKKKIIFLGLESYRRHTSACQGARRFLKLMFVQGIDLRMVKP